MHGDLGKFATGKGVFVFRIFYIMDTALAKMAEPRGIYGCNLEEQRLYTKGLNSTGVGNGRVLCPSNKASIRSLLNLVQLRDGQLWLAFRHEQGAIRGAKEGRGHGFHGWECAMIETGWDGAWVKQLV